MATGGEWGDPETLTGTRTEEVGRIEVHDVHRDGGFAVVGLDLVYRGPGGNVVRVDRDVDSSGSFELNSNLLQQEVTTTKLGTVTVGAVLVALRQVALLLKTYEPLDEGNP